MAYVLVAKYRSDMGIARNAATIGLTLPAGHGQVFARESRSGLHGPPGLSYCRGGPHDPGQLVTISPVEPTAQAASQQPALTASPGGERPFSWRAAGPSGATSPPRASAWTAATAWASSVTSSGTGSSRCPASGNRAVTPSARRAAPGRTGGAAPGPGARCRPWRALCRKESIATATNKPRRAIKVGNYPAAIAITPNRQPPMSPTRSRTR